MRVQPGAEETAIVVKTRWHPLWFPGFFLFHALVTIDGKASELPWGTHVFQVEPGTHEVCGVHRPQGAWVRGHLGRGRRDGRRRLRRSAACHDGQRQKGGSNQPPAGARHKSIESPKTPGQPMTVEIVSPRASFTRHVETASVGRCRAP
jgi:hypothetical protein